MEVKELETPHNSFFLPKFAINLVRWEEVS